jgi:hypothetical protein
MRVSLQRLLAVTTAFIVVAGLASGVPSVSLGFSTGIGCHGAFTMPGTSTHSSTFDAVQVLRRKNMSCSQALHVAARARWLTGVRVIYDPQFGAGGWGGPFHVGALHCYVLHRGSDFVDGKCSRGRRYVRFYDHRSYWQFPDPGFAPPARNA